MHMRARKVTAVEAGFTLIELVAFMVIVSFGILAALRAIDFAAHFSPDPLVQKQALAIAESLLQEIEAQPDTYCDPDDPAVATATSPAGCATPEVLGPEGGETRYSPTTPFDNVNDYNGFSMTGIRNLNNAVITGLGAYNATVSVAQNGFGAVPAAEGLIITVTVTGPGNVNITLQGYRARYAPNSA